MTDFFITFFHPQRIPLAMVALLLTGLVGALIGPRLGSANPLFWMMVDTVLGRVGARLDRAHRSVGDLIVRGVLVTAFGLFLFFMVGKGVSNLVRVLPFGALTEIFFLSLVLTMGTVWQALLRLFIAIKGKKVIKNAYYTIAKSTHTNLSNSDDFTITRVGMGMAARLFDKGAVAPVFWYIIGGLPLAYLYAGIAVLTWRFGRDGFSKGFGSMAETLERIMGFVPTFIAGVLMAIAGLLTPTGGMTRAFAGIMKKKGAAPYAQGGLPVTAMANALNVSLGGPVIDLDGSVIKRDWIGPENATAQLSAGHLRRALYMSVMAYLLLLALMGASLIVVL